MATLIFLWEVWPVMIYVNLPMYQLPILYIAITNLWPNLYPPECFIPYKINNNPNQWRIKEIRGKSVWVSCLMAHAWSQFLLFGILHQSYLTMITAETKNCQILRLVFLVYLVIFLLGDILLHMDSPQSLINKTQKSNFGIVFANRGPSEFYATYNAIHFESTLSIRY